MNRPAQYFSPDYFAAQTRFRKAVTKAGGRLEAIALEAKGPGNEDLTIDIGWFGSETPRRILVHSSGLHGVEAFAGSAIQLQLLDELPIVPGDAAFVIVHVLNPFGMAWLRRFNENNVDLNRNFLEEGEYTGAPETYRELDSILNPPSPPSRDFFLLQAGWVILRHGYRSVKQAVAGGQYEFPKGLFFGGRQLEQGPHGYRTFLAERLASAGQVFAIDVHTGLGKFGEDTLLVESSDYGTLREQFGRRMAALEPDQSVAYRVRGGMHEIVRRTLPKARVYFVVQEFGTYSPIQVLHAIREENRWHHYGAATLDHPTKVKLREAFSPNDESWRSRVLQRGRVMFLQATEFLS
jgi:hypothetical protein